MAKNKKNNISEGEPKREKAVVVFSGGQDSTTCLLWAMKNFKEVVAVGFNYQQKHSVELTCARSICAKLKVDYQVLDISFLNNISVSNLVSSAVGDVNETHALNDKVPSSFVPFRNMIFLTMASAFALKHGTTHLVTGINSVDYSGYPDCRPEFIEALVKALNMATDSEKMSIVIHTPLISLTKADIFKLSADLNGIDLVIEMSHTCYNGDHQHKHAWGYGCSVLTGVDKYDECPSCKIRRLGYEEYQQKYMKKGDQHV
jgi:7-cyano-7-deazaguanine synthase